MALQGHVLWCSKKNNGGETAVVPQLYGGDMSATQVNW